MEDAYLARIEDALKLIMECGGVDGSHHKQWVLDQVVRILAHKDYQKWVYEHNYPQGEETSEDDIYEWDTGIPP